MTEPILVTGANGLVARAVLAALGSVGRVYGLVRVHPQRPLPDNAVPVVHDLRERLDPVLPETPGTIVHLAQSPRYRDFPEGAQDVFEVNVGSTQRLLDWAHRNSVGRFVYCSSGGLYGHGDNAFKEDAPVRPSTDLGHYLTSKHCGELLSKVYGSAMTVIVLRPFFVYGPGQRGTMLVPQLVHRVLQGRSIVLQETNGFRLNPTYVDDAAVAIKAAVGLEESETINVAGPEVLSLREIGTLIGEATGHDPRFEVEPGVKPKHLVGEVSKMTRLLGAPRTRMAEGLGRMISASQAHSDESHAG